MDDLRKDLQEGGGRGDDFRMGRADPVGHETGVGHVGGALEADGEGFEGRLAEGLEFSLDKGGDEGRVEASGQKGGDGPLGHEALLDGGHKRLLDGRLGRIQPLKRPVGGILEPGRDVVATRILHQPCLEMDASPRAGLERPDLSESQEGLHLARHVGTAGAECVKQGADTVGVSPDVGVVPVDQNHGKDAVQGPEKGRGVVTKPGPQRPEHGTVRLGPTVEAVAGREVPPIVNLPVTNPGDAFLREGLHAGLADAVQGEPGKADGGFIVEMDVAAALRPPPFQSFNTVFRTGIHLSQTGPDAAHGKENSSIFMLIVRRDGRG